MTQSPRRSIRSNRRSAPRSRCPQCHGAELAADEIVSGTFRNIAGTISALDASAGTITVQDLATKKSIVVKVTSDPRCASFLLPWPADCRAPQGNSGGRTNACCRFE